MYNKWSYGYGVFPSEKLEESQGTADVKAAISTMEKAFSVYEGYKDQAETNPKMADKAKAELPNVANSMKKAVAVINAYKDKLTTKSGAGKNMGGGLDDKILNNFVSNIDKRIDGIINNATNPNAQSQQNGQQQNGQQPNINTQNMTAEQIQTLITQLQQQLNQKQ